MDKNISVVSIKYFTQNERVEAEIEMWKYNGTSNGMPSNTFVENPKVRQSRWRSIRVMYLTMFLSSVSFSICMSSIWPFLKLLDTDATTDLLGWVVASYSIGQLIASPFFGKMANCLGRSREPLVVSLIINILANILYAYLEDIKEHRLVALIAARALIGFGAGNVAVVRSYLSGATTIKERTAAMANLSAFQAIGFIVGPAIQTAMVPIGYPGPVHKSGIRINLYTAPAFLSALVGLLNLILLFVVFREHRVVDEEYNFSIQDTGREIPEYTPDIFAVVASNIIFFVVLFIFAVFETIGTPLTMNMYAWTRAHATLYNGIILAVGGVVAILVFIVIKFLSKKINERFLLIGGLVCCLLGFVVYLPWGHNYPPSQMAKIYPNSTPSINESWFTVLPSAQTISPYHNQSIKAPAVVGNSSGGNPEATGCPDAYQWCAYTPIVTLAQFLCGTALICIGYPTGNVMSYALYSKILGPKPQGTMMGFLTASGSLARTVGPIFVSLIYNSFGPRVTFLSMCGMIILTLGWILFVYKRLVPFRFEKGMEPPSDI
ncbi:major facilitator superfamily domain-containing protein 8-like isoform X1 [Saccostrea echinata]|uniref:major facilitator superfamily domain-containing protein 8-like isoform X1 n=1 Tax=Saccostrea echinata TaxID=191078 RepID=UPI002A8063BF|nr:major facilitator superfamily domain-containing protein 8-like isoform X1 [Saccostrea echinata]